MPKFCTRGKTSSLLQDSTRVRFFYICKEFADRLIAVDCVHRVSYQLRQNNTFEIYLSANAGDYSAELSLNSARMNLISRYPEYSISFRRLGVNVPIPENCRTVFVRRLRS